MSDDKKTFEEERIALLTKEAVDLVINITRVCEGRETLSIMMAFAFFIGNGITPATKESLDYFTSLFMKYAYEFLSDRAEDGRG